MSDPCVQKALDPLATAKDATPRWIGKDALRALARADEKTGAWD